MIWNECSKVMPPCERWGEAYLVFAGCHGFVLARFDHDRWGRPEWFPIGITVKCRDHITHWMRLPEKPPQSVANGAQRSDDGQ